MKINNVEFDFRVTNLKHASALKTALENMQKSEHETRKKIKADTDVSEAFGAMIDVFRQFFIDATGEDVLTGCDDFMDARKAYEDFLGEIQKQKTAAFADYDIGSIK